MADRVDEFWRWFVAHDMDVREAYEALNSNWLDAELSARVKRIARGASWEIGPYSPPDNALVLSPGTRKELSAVKAAVARAPRIDGWRFIACKPPKDLLSLTFELANVSTNADSWVYRMTSYNGGEFADLEIFFGASDAPPPGKEATLCELVVEAILGEEIRLDRIGVITPVSVSNVRAIEDTSGIRHLKTHLMEVLRPLASNAGVG
jgi:hypothetical protein